MNQKIVFFNIIYYAITILCIIAGKNDPSSSLGYGYFIVAFWILAGIVLGVLLSIKFIRTNSLLDKLGILAATPLFTLIIVALMLIVSPRSGSERYFTKNNISYRVVVTNKPFSGVKEIAFYRSSLPNNSNITPTGDNKWLRDSIWLYISKKGDTLKKVRYKDDVVVNR